MELGKHPVDPRLRVRRTSTYASVIDRSISTERTLGALGGLFGLLGLIVAGLGMFGVLAFRVARRTNELGVRMALGASRGSMMAFVVRDIVGMLVPGLLIGGGVAFTMAGLARTMLFGLEPTEPAVFVIAAASLTVASLLAGWLPALRAARVDPLVALRHE